MMQALDLIVFVIFMIVNSPRQAIEMRRNGR